MPTKWFQKKLLIVPATVAVLSLAAAGVVAAQSSVPQTSSENSPQPTSAKQCYSEPCYGNAGRETVYERIGDGLSDNISTFNNYDRIHANTYSRDTDRVNGYDGDDFIYVDDGDTRDSAGGGSGYDWCYVDATIEASNTCEKVIAR